jgi:hypothetical protein
MQERVAKRPFHADRDWRIDQWWMIAVGAALVLCSFVLCSFVLC